MEATMARFFEWETMKRLCGPEGYCNARLLRGEALARCPHCHACETAFSIWSRVFPAMALLTVSACAGAAFTSSAVLEPDWPDVDNNSAADAGELEVLRVSKDVDASSSSSSSSDAGDARACDLSGCSCGSHVALCCNGPCPAGFEGLSCYCGDCRFPMTYDDAGACR